MMIVRVLVWIARLAGLGALVLGLLFWSTGIDLITFHMLFGLTLALSMLALSLVVTFTKGMRLLAAVGIVYTFILPLFGLTQATLLIGNLHWLIQSAHLLVGLGALALVQAIYTRYQRLKGPTREGIAVPRQAAR